MSRDIHNKLNKFFLFKFIKQNITKIHVTFYYILILNVGHFQNKLLKKINLSLNFIVI